MANNTAPHTPDRSTFTVTVDFAGGTVSRSFMQLAQAIVEFIQEDRVTADDDLAMVCAEALAVYLEKGEFTPGHVDLLRQVVADWPR